MKTLTKAIIVTLASASTLYASDPCYWYASDQKAECYRAYQERQDDKRTSDQQFQAWQALMNQITTHDSQQAKQEDQSIQTNQALNNLIKALNK